MTAGLNLSIIFPLISTYASTGWQGWAVILVLYLGGKAGETSPLLVCLASFPSEHEMDISLHTPDLYQHYPHFYLFFIKKTPNTFSCNYNFWSLIKKSNHGARIAERPLLLVLTLYQKKPLPSGFTEHIFQKSKSKDFKVYFRSAYSVSYSDSSPLLLRRKPCTTYLLPCNCCNLVYSYFQLTEIFG